jgi:hypothetical protein
MVCGGLVYKIPTHCEQHPLSVAVVPTCIRRTHLQDYQEAKELQDFQTCESCRKGSLAWNLFPP